jgi:hypothetical protein
MNDISSVICDMFDIKTNVIKSGLWKNLKDDDGTETTVGDLVNEVLEFLISTAEREFEQQKMEQHYKFLNKIAKGGK